MTEDQIQLVQQSFTAIEPQAGAVAAHFYERLFILDPNLRPLFRGDLEAQGHKLMVALRLVVRSLTRLPAVVPMLRNLGARHAAYGVESGHYVLVGQALLDTLADLLGPACTPNLLAAWQAAYVALADVMQDAAGHLPGDTSRHVGLH